METPSLEGLPTKAKEDPSPHEMSLSPAGHQPSICWCQGLLLLLSLLLLVVVVVVVVIVVVVVVVVMVVVVVVVVLS